jgi:hypothetical protein
MLASADELAREWIAYWQQQLETGDFPDSEVSFIVDRLARDQPEAGWAAILAILAAIDAEPTSRLFQVLAAGPLEDLLSHHGDALIQRVEEQAKRDPKFRSLLGGVWQNEMSQSTWSRVQAIRGDIW